MKKFALATIVLLGFAQLSQAATVSLTDDQAGIASFSLDASGLQFNTVTLDVTPDAGSSLKNVDDAGLGNAGDDNTFANGYMAAPTAFGGFGWSVVGQTVTADGLSFAAGPLGAFIADDNYLLANLSYDGPGTYSWTLQDTGNVVASGDGTYGVPEPGTLALAGLSLLGLAFRRR